MNINLLLLDSLDVSLPNISDGHHYAHPFKPQLSIVNIYLIDVKPTVKISPATILVYVWKVIAIKLSTITLRSISTFSFAIASGSIWRDNYIFRNLNRLDIFKTYNSNNQSEVMASTIGNMNCIPAKTKRKYITSILKKKKKNSGVKTETQKGREQTLN
jgi:hypothetical protein